jgi:hypothetical protein
MEAKTLLEAEIIRVVTRPMAFPEIEAEIGRLPNFELGIALTKMVLDGRMYYKPPEFYGTIWPLYSTRKMTKKDVCPKRCDLKPNCYENDPPSNPDAEMLGE